MCSPAKLGRRAHAVGPERHRLPDPWGCLMRMLAAQAGEVCSAIADRLAESDDFVQPQPRAADDTSVGTALLAARFAQDRPAFSDVAVAQVQSMIKALPAPSGSIVSGTLGAVASAVLVQAMTGDPRLHSVVSPG